VNLKIIDIKVDKWSLKLTKTERATGEY